MNGASRTVHRSLGAALALAVLLSGMNAIGAPQLAVAAENQAPLAPTFRSAFAALFGAGR